MIEKVSTVDKIEVLESGIVQVRTKNAVIEDGIQIGGTFHRHVIAPGADYSNEDARVQAICAATHTPEVIDAYRTAIAAQGV
jgi:hypothetical protein